MSTQFTEHDITNLEEWNDVLYNGCCCSMPSCYAPYLQAESRSTRLSECGTDVDIPDSGAWNPIGCPAEASNYAKLVTVFAVSRTGYADYTRTTTVTYTRDDSNNSCDRVSDTVTDGDVIPARPSWANTVTQDQGGDYFFSYEISGSDAGDTYSELTSYTYSDRVTIPDKLFDEAEIQLPLEPLDGNSSSAEYEIHADTSAYDCFDPPVPTDLELTDSEVTFLVDYYFEGSSFQVTYDIIEEPEGWDDMVGEDHDPDAPPRTFFSQDNVLDWVGPRDPEDPDSLIIGVVSIPHPIVPGIRRIVNIRFNCYPNSPFGFRNQIFTDPITLPDPWVIPTP